jgi:NADPH2:quinone reductase
MRAGAGAARSEVTSRAWVVAEPFGTFQEKAIPLPVLGPHQALVRIAASGVNPIDTKIRKGAAEHAWQPLPAVLCLDMAGIVEQVGPEVTSFKQGDEVYGMAGGVGGLPGTLAERICVDVDLLAHKPSSLSMRQAAALPLSVITAWEGLVDRAKVRDDQTVLIHAGAGGIGYIAIQIAQEYGARVFATVSPGKKKFVESLGAFAIDYRSTST